MCVKLLRWFVVYTQTIRVVPRFQTFRPYGWKVFFIFKSIYERNVGYARKIEKS